MFQTFLEFNFPFIISILFLLLFIITNQNFNKKINHRLYLIIFLLTVVVVSDNLLYVAMHFGELLKYPIGKTGIKTLVALSGSIRPSTILIVVLLFKSNMTKKMISIYCIPTIISIIIYITGIFSSIVVYFDENNNLHNGPLSLTASFVALFYLCLMIFYAFKTFRRKNYMEFAIMLCVFAAVVFGIVIKAVFGYYFVLNSANAISLTFIYLFLNVQKFKRDELTDALNRRSFIADSERLGSELKAIISIDLNDLKILNDVNGHEEGDKALRTLSDIVKSCLIRGTELYRTGGDEFEILCGKKTTAIDLERMVCDMKLKMEDCPYRFAIGIGYAQEGSTADSVRAEADAQMYKDKAQMKGGAKNIR